MGVLAYQEETNRTRSDDRQYIGYRMKNIPAFDDFGPMDRVIVESASIGTITLMPMKGAGMYGDDHPEGTMEADGLSFEQAKAIEKLLNLKTGNAPDGFDVSKIESTPIGRVRDMSVQARYGQPNHFIELTKEMDGSWTLTCGPKAVERIRKALGMDEQSIWPKIQPGLFEAEDGLRKAMNTLNSIDPKHGALRSMAEAAEALAVVRRYFKQ